MGVQRCTEMENCSHQIEWCAVNTNPRCEELVYRILAEKSFNAFLPKVPKASIKGTPEPLFPGYLFVQLNLNSPDLATVKHLHGVRRILGFGIMPMPIPEEIIRNLMERMNNHSSSGVLLPFKEGDKVRLKKGPFEGLEGIFTGRVSGKERVKILLKAVERWVFTIEADARELSRI